MIVGSFSESDYRIFDDFEFSYKDADGVMLDYSYFKPYLKHEDKLYAVPYPENLVLAKLSTNLTDGNMFINSPYAQAIPYTNNNKKDIRFLYSGNGVISNLVKDQATPSMLRSYALNAIALDPNEIRAITYIKDYDDYGGGGIGVWNGWMKICKLRKSVNTGGAANTFIAADSNITVNPNAPLTVYTKFSIDTTLRNNDARSNNVSLLALSISGFKGGNPTSAGTDKNMFSKIIYTYTGELAIYNGLVGTRVLTQPITITDGTWHEMWVVMSSTGLRIIIDGLEIPIPNITGNGLANGITDYKVIGLYLGGNTSGTYNLKRIWAWEAALNDKEMGDMNKIFSRDLRS